MVCVIDAIGFFLVLKAWLSVNHRLSWLVAVLPLAVLLQFAVSVAYHWFPQNHLRQRVDQGMIVLLVAITYVPFWGTFLPASELWWRTPIVVALTVGSLVFRCAFLSWWRISAGLYLLLGGFGCVLSFSESQSWLPPTGLAEFWLGIGCYVLQYLVWALHKPDPLPGVFGYREVQHLILVGGMMLHTNVVLHYL